jgi:hypothetical protein
VPHSVFLPSLTLRYQRSEDQERADVGFGV